MKIIFTSTLLLLLTLQIFSQTLNLPPRQQNALTGSEFAQLVWDLSLTDRENEIYSQVMSGNIPDFQRNLIPVNFSSTISGQVYNVTYFVSPDYLAIGNDTNYFLIPMTPLLAQKICNQTGTTMPTRKMVDQIWSKATVKLAPSTIPPSPQMTTIPVMYQHSQIVWNQRKGVIATHPLGELVGGTKKDVVISNRIYGFPPPGRVVIYGWHYLNGTPIQPLYNGHGETYADYSHGIRLVQDSIIINGEPSKITTILQNDTLHTLFSDEGKIQIPYYPSSTSSIFPPNAWGVVTEDENSLRLVVHNNPEVTHYKVHLSSDGKIFTSSVIVEKNNPLLTGLQQDSLNYIRLQAIGSDTSAFTEVLAGIPTNREKKTLIVNGFDRPVAGNTYDFIRMHSSAIINYGHNFESASNEAIIYGLFNLNDYEIVVWILGTESTADETFSSIEQTCIIEFLRNGGCLFVSGSEIAWDLDNRGSESDKQFIRNYLKSAYVADAPNNQANTFYIAEGIPDEFFSGVSNINFDNGTQGTYNVSWPDVVNGINGGVNILHYTGLTSNNVAGTAFKGMFPSGTKNGAVVLFGFPFETIYPETKRFEVMNKVLQFFENLTDINNEFLAMPNDIVLYQNYPNPFNPSTKIKFKTVESGIVTLKVYDILGQELITLFNKEVSAGEINEVIFDAGNLTSGIYLYKLVHGGKIEMKKMLLVR